MSDGFFCVNVFSFHHSFHFNSHQCWRALTVPQFVTFLVSGTAKEKKVQNPFWPDLILRNEWRQLRQNEWAKDGQKTKSLLPQLLIETHSIWKITVASLHRSKWLYIKWRLTRFSLVKSLPTTLSLYLCIFSHILYGCSNAKVKRRFLLKLIVISLSHRLHKWISLQKLKLAWNNEINEHYLSFHVQFQCKTCCFKLRPTHWNEHDWCLN